MKSGERRALLAVLAGGIGILVLTVYLESQYQQREGKIDRVHAQKSQTITPGASPKGLDARVIPKGLDPQGLPDADSHGATLLTLYCVQCHDLPTPLMHTAEEWPAVIDRMQKHMASHHSGMLAHVIMPSRKDWQSLRSYMVDNAQVPLDRDRYADLDSPQGRSFESVCSQCHAAPMPTQHTAHEWPRVVLRMKSHMKNAGKAVPDVRTTEQIVDFLQRHAGLASEPNPGV